MKDPVDFVIITPLVEERDALLAKLEHRKLPPVPDVFMSIMAPSYTLTWPMITGAATAWSSCRCRGWAG